jgi:Antitoxin VbhA
MPNPVLNQSDRQKNVDNMLASLRIEKLSPSESLKPSLKAYVEGHKTTTDLLNEVKAKYDALRRG